MSWRHLSDFHFLRPWWLLALLALPLLAKAFGARGGAGGWRRAVDPHLLRFLLVGGAGRKHSPWPGRAAALAWVLAVLALAGPAWQRLPEPLYETVAPRVLLLDLSASMNATDVAPRRITRARYKLLDALKRSREGQIGLVAYAGDAHVIAPMTPDANTVAALVPDLAPELMPRPGSRADEAVARAVQLLENAGYRQGELLLIGDEIDAAQAEAIAGRLAGTPFRLSILGVGSAEGAPIPLARGRGFLKDKHGNIVLPRLDRTALAALAARCGGRYAELAADDRDLEYLAPTAPIGATRQAAARELTSERWADRGPYLVLALLPLALWGFRRGWLGLVLLGMSGLLAAPEASALSWQDLWQRADQQGQAAFASGAPAEAATRFTDPEWQGAAWYRAGEHAKAAEAFRRADSADAHYNRGNALARQGRLDEAIRAYDEALERAPGMADAQANRELLQGLRQQQQQNQPNKAGQPGQRSPSQGGNGSAAPDSPPQGQAGEEGRQADGAPAPGEPNAAPGQAAEPAGGTDRQASAGDGDADGDADGKTAPDRHPSQQAPAEAAQPSESGQPGGPPQEAERGTPDPEDAGAGRAATGEGEPGDERNLKLEQRLQKVPDDPGGLLREKLRREAARRPPRDEDDEEVQPW